MPGVVVTGMGVASALGWSLESTWDHIANQRRGLRPLDCIASPRFAGWPVGQLPDDPATRSGLPDGSRSDHLAVIVARDALTNAALDADSDLANVGLVLGVTTGGLNSTEVYLDKLLKDGIPDFPLMRFHECATPGRTAAAALGIGGPQTTLSTACAAGASAISVARDFIDGGLADIVLAGGVDTLTRLTINGFQSLKICDPEGCRPFDRNRRGMTLGEGAAILVLESEEHARERGARVWARLLSAGSSCDGYHATAPMPDGSGVLRAMARALDDAGLAPDAVDYVNAHGTGTRENDAAESAALNALFGASRPPVSSTKGYHGHTLAAAGAIEAVISILAMGNGEVPVNVGFSEVDPALALSPAARRDTRPIDVVMSNSVGFSGNNCVLLFGRDQ